MSFRGERLLFFQCAKTDCTERTFLLTKVSRKTSLEKLQQSAEAVPAPFGRNAEDGVLLAAAR